LAPKLLNAQISQLKSEKDKFNFILDYVKNNFSWNNIYGKYATKSPGKLIDEKHGNSADINLFTTGLLNSAGLVAYPVILSTRDNGKIYDKYPYSNFFNYVIISVKVDGEDILTDATDVSCLNYRIPTRCINDKGLLIKEGTIQWIGLDCLIPSEIITEIAIEKKSDDLQLNSVKKMATEYNALYYRNSYSDDIQTIKKRLESEHFTLIDTTVLIQNQKEIEKPYIISYKLSSHPEVLNDKLFVTPFINEVINNNPLKQIERTYPIDMIYPEKRRFISSIKIPDGYQIEFLPSESIINNQFFELNYSIKNDDNNIVISFYYYFKKPVYYPGDYSKIKYYFNEIVKKGNEKIVLTKKI
jgi:hypothetical protein